jgi:lactoylglutathione lyase
MISRIATAAVYVEDQQKAKAFWVEKAGFEVTVETPMGPGATWLEVAPKGAQSALVLYPRTV